MAVAAILIFRFGDEGLAMAQRYGIVREQDIRACASWWGQARAAADYLRTVLIEVDGEDHKRWLEHQINKLRLAVFDWVWTEGNMNAAIQLLRGYDRLWQEGRGKGVQINVLQQRVQYRSPITGKVVELALDEKDEKALPEGGMGK